MTTLRVSEPLVVWAEGGLGEAAEAAEGEAEVPEEEEAGVEGEEEGEETARMHRIRTGRRGRFREVGPYGAQQGAGGAPWPQL